MFVCLIACLLASAGPLPSPPVQTPAQPKLELDTRDFQLPSGLRVVMQPDSTQPVVGITMVIDHGSVSDPVGKEGLAHVVEHMVFRAKHGELPPVWDLLGQLGCSKNASTSSEWTDYRTACPADMLPLMLRLESARLRDAVAGVTAPELDAEREVIRNELRMRAENGFQAILPYTYAMLFPKDDPRSRSVIGSHESLDAITIADVQKFTRDYYKPENVTIAIVGDFDPDRAGDLLASNLDLELLHPELTEEHLRRFPKPGLKGEPDPEDPEHWVMWPVQPGTEEPLELGGHQTRASGEPPEPPKPPKQSDYPVYEAPVEYPSLAVAWTLPGGYRGNSVALDYIRHGANNAVYDVLPKDSRDRLVGEYTSYGCSVFEDRANSILLCQVVPPAWMDRAKLAKKIINGQSTSGWLNAWMAGWQRNSVVRDALMNLERAADIGDGRATRLAHFVHQRGRTDLANQMIQEISTYSAEDTERIASRWISSGRARAVILDPMPPEKRDQRSRFEGAGTWRSLEDTLAVSDVSPKAIYQSAAALDFDQVREKTLDNGLKVVVYPHGNIPYVRATLVALGGKATSDPRFPTMSSYMIDWDREDATRVGGYWTSSYGSSVQQQGLVGLSANLDNVLFLLRKSVQNRSFERQDLGTWVRDRKIALEDDVLSRSYWTSRLENRSLGQGNPVLWGTNHDTVDQVKEVDLPGIERWVDSVWQPANTTLVIVGNVKPQRAFRNAETYFSSWTGEGERAPRQPAAMAPEPVDETWLLDEPLWTQTEVRLSCAIAPGKLETKAARDLLEEVLDDRVRALRERDGVTYGGSAYVSHWNNGYNELTMSVLVQNDAVTKALQTFDAAIDEVTRGEITPETVRAAAWMRAVSTPLALDTQYNVQQRLFEVVAERGEWTDLAQYPRHIARGTPEQVTAALGDCATRRVVTVVGPQKTIAPQLDAAGVDYQVFDWRAEGLKVLEDWNGKMANRVRKERSLVSGTQ